MKNRVYKPFLFIFQRLLHTWFALYLLHGALCPPGILSVHRATCGRDRRAHQIKASAQKIQFSTRVATNPINSYAVR